MPHRATCLNHNALWEEERARRKFALEASACVRSSQEIWRCFMWDERCQPVGQSWFKRLQNKMVDASCAAEGFCRELNWKARKIWWSVGAAHSWLSALWLLCQIHSLTSRPEKPTWRTNYHRSMPGRLFDPDRQIQKTRDVWNTHAQTRKYGLQSPSARGLPQRCKSSQVLEF